MLSPRWKKLWRDLQSARGRMVMMVLAIAVSIFGVGTMTQCVHHLDARDRPQLSGAPIQPRLSSNWIRWTTL